VPTAIDDPLGQKQTFAVARAHACQGPKADITGPTESGPE